MAGSQDNDRGKPVKFTGGKYAGCSGWIDKGKGETRRSVYVIILLNDGRTKRTRVLKEGIEPESTPTNFAEALMKEYPDIRQILKKLTSLLAQVEMDSDETDASQEWSPTFMKNYCKPKKNKKAWEEGHVGGRG